MPVNLFQIGQNALKANQSGIGVAGRNISNVNTPGYSRQEVSFTTAIIGEGVTIAGIRSFRDQFINSRLVTETGINGRLQGQRDALVPVETALTDSSDSGIQGAIAKFFGAFKTLESYPTSLSIRSQVITSGVALSNAFTSTNSRLVDIRSSTDGLVRSEVDQVNLLSSQVADLNSKIGLTSHLGEDTSGLEDQRDQLIRSLSELAGVHETQNGDNTVTLSLSDGRPIVVSNHSFNLTVASTPPNGLASISLSGQPAVINNGKIRGLLDATTEITSQITSLDDLAASISSRVNTEHSAGSDLNANPGTNFFIPSGGAPAITAATISVSATIQADPKRVVAAASGAGGGDATVARSISNLFTDQTSIAGVHSGSFSSIYGAIVSDAGDSIKSADDELATQQLILNQTIEQRNAFSGVSLDEEAVNLLRYQRGYEAAARFLRVANEVTQTILSLGQ